MDGIRAHWNGETLRSRTGNEIPLPTWFVDGLPKDIPFDGELWLGRGSQELLNGLLYSTDDPAWKNVRYALFDLPNSEDPYELRMRELARLKLPNHVLVADIQMSRGKDHLRKCLAEVMENGGEGVMLNKPNSIYIPTRTNSLLKLKAKVSFLSANEYSPIATVK